MIVEWAGKPGNKNLSVEVDHARCGEYYFSLCKRQDTDDPFKFRLFVYHDDKGYKHLSPNNRDGFNTITKAKAFVSAWEDK